MTPESIALVKTSWAQVQPISGQAAALFYGRLFEVYPEVKPLFKGDMREQGRKLMTMIATAVNALDRLEPMVPAIKALGARHAGYGVESADYDKVADALLWTLGQGLGDAFTPDVKDAWTQAYTALASTMLAGVEEGAAAS
jgi:hemoglobin-like flavoprotein